MATRAKDGPVPKKARKKPSCGGKTTETMATVDEGGGGGGVKPKKGGGRKTKKDERKPIIDPTMATVIEEEASRKIDVIEAEATPRAVPKKTTSVPVPRRSPSRGSDNQLTEEQAQFLANYRMAINDDRVPVVQDFLKRVLLRDKPTESLGAEFRAHKRANDFSKMTAFLANQTRNRYKDVGCLDNNRVQLVMGGQPYIHANFVGTSTEAKKFICCQAPLESTVADFWHMIAQEGCRCIVMLCNYMEKNLPKCAHYLPAAFNVPQTFGLITVTTVSSGRLALKEPTKTIVNRTTVMLTWEVGNPAARTPTNSSSSRDMKCLQVEHLHWLDWPDRGVPPADNVPIELIQHVQQHHGNPVVVHCSAGIGRTGCVVLMDILLAQLYKRIPWPADLHLLLTEIRNSRNNSIQTEQQYLYCHQVMINFLKKECLLTPEMVKAHFAWTLAYNKACEAFN